MPPPKHVHPGRLVVSKPDLPSIDSGEPARPCPHQDFDSSGTTPARCRCELQLQQLLLMAMVHSATAAFSGFTSAIASYICNLPMREGCGDHFLGSLV